MHGSKMLKNSDRAGSDGKRTCMAIQKRYTSGPQGTVIDCFRGNDFVIAVCQNEADPHRKHPSYFPQESIALFRSSSNFRIIHWGSLFCSLGDYPIPIQSSQRVELSIRVKSISPSMIPYTRRKIKRAKKKANPSFWSKCVFMTSSSSIKLYKCNTGIV